MAVNQVSIDKAEITVCSDNAPTGRPLPWAFLRFGDVEEERKYLIPRHPTYGGFGGVGNNEEVMIVGREHMPYVPFPAEQFRPLRVNSPGNDNQPGPIAIHFFGFV